MCERRRVSEGSNGHQTSTALVPTGEASEVDRIVPITGLNLYVYNWKIKARVISRTDKIPMKNGQSMFSFLINDQSGEMRVVAFGRECKRWFDLIEPKKVYYFEKGTIKPSDSRFGLPGAEFEIHLSGTSHIEPCDDESEL